MIQNSLSIIHYCLRRACLPAGMRNEDKAIFPKQTALSLPLPVRVPSHHHPTASRALRPRYPVPIAIGVMESYRESGLRHHSLNTENRTLTARLCLRPLLLKRLIGRKINCHPPIGRNAHIDANMHSGIVNPES